MVGFAATARRIATITAVTTGLMAAQAAPSGAAWAVNLGAGSRAQASSGVLAAPTGVTSACASRTTVTVSWTASNRATSYTVLRSTSTGTAPYTSVASVSGTSWTSGALGAGSYSFQVQAGTGNWTSAPSSATAVRTLGNNSCA